MFCLFALCSADTCGIFFWILQNFRTIRPDGAADNFVMSQKSHIIAKKYSRQIRSTVFRKLQPGKEVEDEEGPNGLERKPLARFPEGRVTGWEGHV